MKKIMAASIVLILPLLLFSCKEMEIPPAGSYSEVLLVTEDGPASGFLPLVLPYISRELHFYTSDEKQFHVSVVKAADLPDFPSTKNILIVGVADELTSIGQMIETLIGRGGMAKVSSGRASILKRENLPAPGQLTVIVTAKSGSELEQVLEERGGEIPDIIEASCRKRLRRFFLDFENEELERYLNNKYGFSLVIPTLYKLQSEAKRPPGIELMRENPTRSLGVFWVDWKHEPTSEDVKKLFKLREDYVFERYDGDAMDSTRVEFSGAKLGRYDAIEMAGYWYNTRSIAGGAYRTYFVYDEKDELLWAVDLLVYAPGGRKHPLFRELLALAETFRYD
jgi:hypothetical protein